jgi:hypothetical protein
MTSLVWVVAVIGARGSLSLLALGLRLRWHAQRQQERHRYLVAIARALPESSQIDEGQPDGTWLRLTVSRPGLVVVRGGGSAHGWHS